MDIKIYTSEEILAAEDLYHIQEQACTGAPIYYRLTDEEVSWLEFASDQFDIAVYILTNSMMRIDEETDHCTVTLTISDVGELCAALDADSEGAGKAALLSDETALQRLIFWLYPETERNHND